MVGGIFLWLLDINCMVCGLYIRICTVGQLCFNGTVRVIYIMYISSNKVIVYLLLFSNFRLKMGLK